MPPGGLGRAAPSEPSVCTLSSSTPAEGSGRGEQPRVPSACRLTGSLFLTTFPRCCPAPFLPKFQPNPFSREQARDVSLSLIPVPSLCNGFSSQH